MKGARRNEHQSEHDTAIPAIQAEFQRRSKSTDTADAQQRTDKSESVRSGGADGTTVSADVNTRCAQVMA